MNIYHLYEFDYHDSDRSFGYYLSKEKAEAEKVRLQHIQDAWSNRWDEYQESLSLAKANGTERPIFPDSPKELYSGEIKIEEITLKKNYEY